MARASDRDRSSRRSRDENTDRDRDRKHNPHHRDDAAEPRESRRSNDDKRWDGNRDRRHRRSPDPSEVPDPRGEERIRTKEDGRRERRRLRDPLREERERESVERVRSRSQEESVEERLAPRKRKEHGERELGDKGGEKRARISGGDGDGDVRRERRREDKGVDKDERRGERKAKEERRSKDERRGKRGFKDELKEEELFSGGDGMGESRLSEKVEDEGRDVFMDEEADDKRFEGEVEEEVNGDDYEVKTEKLQRDAREERIYVDGGFGIGDGGCSEAKGFAPEPPVKPSELVQNTSAASSYHFPPKVSSVTTTIENGLINRADEVHGKSSTDGATTSMIGKSGSLSLDALAKAKKALQMQKELAQKLKKIPMLGKLSRSVADGNVQVDTSKGIQKVSMLLSTETTATSIQAFSSPSSITDVASAPSLNPSTTAGVSPLSGLTVEAVKRAQEVAARMGFRQDPQFAPLINMFPGTVPEVAIPQKPSKAPVLRLDAQGREIDEHGNVINMPKPTNLSTLKVNINKQKKEAFQILKPDLDANVELNPYFDTRMGINKTKLLRPKRMAFQFVEEGKWSKQAEITRFKNQFGEAQAKELKMKQAQLAKAKAEPDINPNLIELSERIVIKGKKQEQIPDVEWWDIPLLPSGKYDDVADVKINMEKITIYVEHPLPVQPPAEAAPPPPQPLKLTRKETKKLRTQRRLAKERDRQEMIRQGLMDPPKSKVKMTNLMKVLGSEATQAPTKLDMEIRSAAAEREQAHVDRNIARKLTPSERREKKERKLFDDPYTLETIVTIYRMNSLTHPKIRFQVDVNAQENRLTGCAVISEGMCVVVVEGGRKSNKRYKNLMLKRIDWAAVVENEDDGDIADAPINKCLLVWQGSVVKPSFNRFLIHQCRTEAAARKVLADAGVPHYWDLAVNFSDG